VEPAYKFILDTENKRILVLVISIKIINQKSFDKKIIFHFVVAAQRAHHLIYQQNKFNGKNP